MDRHESPVSRRAVLTSSAMVLGGGALTTTATASNGRGSNGGAGNGRCSCPDGRKLLAKYEANQTSGEFEFEEGDERFDVDGSVVRFDDIVTKEDDENEILAFSWDSSPFHVKTVKIKAGDNCLSVPTEEETSGRIDIRELIDENPIPAISNVQFCKIVYYQVDFVVEDEPIEPPRYGGEGLISALTGNSEKDVVELRRFGNYRLLEDEEDGWEISVSSDGTQASVDFTLDEQPAEPLLLASYEIPGPLDKSEIEVQVLVDSETGEFDAGDSGSLSVELPQVE